LLEFMHPDMFSCGTPIPQLRNLSSNFSSSINMVSIAVTVEVPGYRNPPTVDIIREFKLRCNTSWTYLAETSGTYVRDTYHVLEMNFPAFFLIGKDGKIVYKDEGWGHLPALEAAITNELSR